MITDLDEATAYYMALDDPLGPEELAQALGRVGRNPVLGLLVDLFYASLIEDEALTAELGGAWSIAEYPELVLDREMWLEMFDVAGYTVDGVAAPLPVEPVRLYRGAVPGHQERMAWTDDVTVARWFAARPTNVGGLVWTALVEPHRLLCRLHEGGRGESEYVINPEGLEIVVFDEQLGKGQQ